MKYTYLETPIGKLLLAGDKAGLHQIGFETDGDPAADWLHDPDAFEELEQQLSDYFAGTLQTFTVPLAPQGTPFQKRVWEEVRAIPYGEVASYAEIASNLNIKNGARRIGSANACNPIPIIVPCHRVVGSSGALTGYRGGLEIKRALLDIEQGLVATV